MQFFYFTLIFFPKWVKESNITSQVFSFADAVGNQEHPKNYGNGNGNGNYNYHLHLLLVFHVFLVDLAIEKREYFTCSRLECHKTNGKIDGTTTFCFRTNGTKKIDWWVSTSLICKISYFQNSIVTDKKKKKKKNPYASKRTSSFTPEICVSLI